MLRPRVENFTDRCPGIIASPSDELVPFEQNAARYARSIPHARLTTVPGAGHFIFMPVCTLPGRLVAAAVCVDVAAAPDRAAVHAETDAGIVTFFRHALGTGRNVSAP